MCKVTKNVLDYQTFLILILEMVVYLAKSMGWQ